MLRIPGMDQETDDERDQDEDQEIEDDRPGADRGARDDRLGPQRRNDDVGELREHGQ